MFPVPAIEKLNHADPAVRAAIFDFLAPHEARTLFILGNLNSGFPEQHLYAALRDGRWVGLAGYYGLPRSLIPFSLEPAVTRALVRHIAAEHEVIEWMHGPGHVARPALEALAELGYEPTCSPWHVFMEAELPDQSAIPRCEHEHLARVMRPEDAPEVARLIRSMRHPDDDSPPTDRQIEMARTSPMRMVIEQGGQIVCTASTNGIGLRAFQILAVVTHAAHRRRGYARSLCAVLMRRMHAQGASHCVLFADVNNTAAQRCYESLGFRITDDWAVTPLRRKQA